jgi:predicted acylesterase/phospholipase RssA
MDPSCNDTKADEKANEKANEKAKSKSKIRHIVLSGGGVLGISAYGALKYLHNNGIWNIQDIESIYGTSVGAIISVVIALKYKWEDTDDYVIKRPWDQAFPMSVTKILDSYQKKGIFEMNEFEEFLKPLICAQDLSINITMKEFYEWSNIDIHIITTDLDELSVVDISYKTHPEWRLMDAVYASAALPILFSPLYHGEKYYSDGGILCNYPIYECILRNKNPDEILGFSRKETVKPPTFKPIKCVNSPIAANHALLTADISLNIGKLDAEPFQCKTTIFDYLLFLLNSIAKKFSKYAKQQRVLDKENPDISIKHTILFPSGSISLYDIYLFSTSIDERKRLVQYGERIAAEYIESMSKESKESKNP